MSGIRRQVAAKIKKLRKEQKLSQEELAHLCGLHRTYIGSVERGERNISIENIEKIADALGVPVRDIFE